VRRKVGRGKAGNYADALICVVGMMWVNGSLYVQAAQDVCTAL
jgi:hypothetical protein